MHIYGDNWIHVLPELAEQLGVAVGTAMLPSVFGPVHDQRLVGVANVCRIVASGCEVTGYPAVVQLTQEEAHRPLPACCPRTHAQDWLNWCRVVPSAFFCRDNRSHDLPRYYAPTSAGSGTHWHGSVLAGLVAAGYRVLSQLEFVEVQRANE